MNFHLHSFNPSRTDGRGEQQKTATGSADTTGNKTM